MISIVLMSLLSVPLCAKPLLCAHNHVPGFGKTHFILGQPVAEDAGIQAAQESAPAPSTNELKTKAFFAPDHDMRKELIQLIDDEKASIAIAMFLLTDHDIANALTRAQKRNVSVQLITDSSCLRERYNKVGMLCDAGCTIYVYNPSYNKKDTSSSIMHHKFALFEKNKLGQPLLWTGSFNFTKAGSQINQENVLLVEDKQVIGQFEEQFKKLKTRSHRYGNGKQK